MKLKIIFKKTIINNNLEKQFSKSTHYCSYNRKGDDMEEIGLYYFQ